MHFALEGCPATRRQRRPSGVGRCSPLRYNAISYSTPRQDQRRLGLLQQGMNSLVDLSEEVQQGLILTLAVRARPEPHAVHRSHRGTAERAIVQIVIRLPRVQPHVQICGRYEFIGSVLRTYADNPQDAVTVVRSGDFRFYMNRDVNLKEGDRVRGSGMLLLDHFVWGEFLARYRDPPDVFYQLSVERIRRVRIPGAIRRSKRAWQVNSDITRPGGLRP